MQRECAKIKFVDVNIWCILEIHLLHASHLQVSVDVCGRVYFSWMCMMFVNNNKSNFVFLPKLRLHVFWSCMTFFNKFVENMNEFGCLWKEFEEFLEMDDEFEHVEFIQQYGTFEM